jgi:hypothetical protein
MILLFAQSSSLSREREQVGASFSVNNNLMQLRESRQIRKFCALIKIQCVEELEGAAELLKRERMEMFMLCILKDNKQHQVQSELGWENIRFA